MSSFKTFVVLCSFIWLAYLPVQAAEPDQSTDLVRLGTSLNDAKGELEIAQLRLEKLKALHEADAGSVSDLEVITAKINAQTAGRKVALLKEIVEIETESTKQLVALLQQQKLNSAKPVLDQLIRAEARLRILQAIAKVR